MECRPSKQQHGDSQIVLTAPFVLFLLRPFFLSTEEIRTSLFGKKRLSEATWSSAKNACVLSTVLVSLQHAIRAQHFWS